MHSKGYVFAQEHGGSEIMEIESHDVEFMEDVFPSISHYHSTIELQEIPDIDLPLPVAEDICRPSTTMDSESLHMTIDDSGSESSILVPVRKSA